MITQLFYHYPQFRLPVTSSSAVHPIQKGRWVLACRSLQLPRFSSSRNNLLSAIPCPFQGCLFYHAPTMKAHLLLGCKPLKNKDSLNDKRNTQSLDCIPQDPDLYHFFPPDPSLPLTMSQNPTRVHILCTSSDLLRPEYSCDTHPGKSPVPMVSF